MEYRFFILKFLGSLKHESKARNSFDSIKYKNTFIPTNGIKFSRLNHIKLSKMITHFEKIIGKIEVIKI